MKTRIFDLGTVLTVTTGIVFTSMDNIYEILDYMTADSLFTHQLPRAARECAPEIIKQYPRLGEIKAVDITNWKEFLDAQIKKYGNSFEIKPLEKYNHVDALDEAADMIGKEKVEIVII